MYVNCPDCHGEVTVPDDAAGQMFGCPRPGCGGKFIVPDASDVPEATLAVPMGQASAPASAPAFQLNKGPDPAHLRGMPDGLSRAFDAMGSSGGTQSQSLPTNSPLGRLVESQQNLAKATTKLATTLESQSKAIAPNVPAGQPGAQPAGQSSSLPEPVTRTPGPSSWSIEKPRDNSQAAQDAEWQNRLQGKPDQYGALQNLLGSLGSFVPALGQAASMMGKFRSVAEAFREYDKTNQHARMVRSGEDKEFSAGVNERQALRARERDEEANPWKREGRLAQEAADAKRRQRLLEEALAERGEPEPLVAEPASTPAADQADLVPGPKAQEFVSGKEPAGLRPDERGVLRDAAGNVPAWMSQPDTLRASDLPESVVAPKRDLTASQADLYKENAGARAEALAEEEERGLRTRNRLIGNNRGLSFDPWEALANLDARQRGKAAPAGQSEERGLVPFRQEPPAVVLRRIEGRVKRTTPEVRLLDGPPGPLSRLPASESTVASRTLAPSMPALLGGNPPSSAAGFSPAAPVAGPGGTGSGSNELVTLVRQMVQVNSETLREIRALKSVFEKLGQGSEDELAENVGGEGRHGISALAGGGGDEKKDGKKDGKDDRTDAGPGDRAMSGGLGVEDMIRDALKIASFFGGS